MPVEAIYAGGDSTLRLPTSPALLLTPRPGVGPSGSTWHGPPVSCRPSLEDDDPWHPYSVLTRWQMMIEEDYGLRDTRKMTISGAVAFFARDDGRFLHRFANDPDQDFPLFAREVAACLTHLEAVIHAGPRVPELGAPCPECSDEAGFADRLVKRYVDEDPTGASDRWVCPVDPGHYWSEADYGMRVGAELSRVRHSPHCRPDPRPVPHRTRHPPTLGRRGQGEEAWTTDTDASSMTLLRWYAREVIA